MGSNIDIRNLNLYQTLHTYKVEWHEMFCFKIVNYTVNIYIQSLSQCSPTPSLFLSLTLPSPPLSPSLPRPFSFCYFGGSFKNRCKVLLTLISNIYQTLQRISFYTEVGHYGVYTDFYMSNCAHTLHN